MQFLKNGPAKSLGFNCSDLQRMSILGGYKSLSCTFFSILPSVRRTVWGELLDSREEAKSVSGDHYWSREQERQREVET